jgi:hypothetical protein
MEGYSVHSIDIVTEGHLFKPVVLLVHYLRTGVEELHVRYLLLDPCLESQLMLPLMNEKTGATLYQ